MRLASRLATQDCVDCHASAVLRVHSHVTLPKPSPKSIQFILIFRMGLYFTPVQCKHDHPETHGSRSVSKDFVAFFFKGNRSLSYSFERATRTFESSGTNSHTASNRRDLNPNLSLPTTWRRMGREEVGLLSFVTFALVGGKWSALRSGRFNYKERSSRTYRSISEYRI
jgi:hypothetical protein